MRNIKRYLLLPICFVWMQVCVGQNIAQIKSALTDSLYANFSIGAKDYQVATISINDQQKTVRVNMSDKFEQQRFTPAVLDSMKRLALLVLGQEYEDYSVSYLVKGVNVEKLISNIYLPKNKRDNSKYKKNKSTIPTVVPLDRAYQIKSGLNNRQIALWHSHGLYYEQLTDRWRWQRARVMTTVEDKFTMSFVLPYLLPMLSRSGAVVWLPRERCLQEVELVIDNDVTAYTTGTYTEKGNGFQTLGRSAFAYTKDCYHHKQNPFSDGTARLIKTTSDSTAAAVWKFAVPDDGYYWVSVTYPSVGEAVSDAKYSVIHAGGVSHYAVNQQVAPSTWVYLDNLYFKANEEYEIVLTNESAHRGVVVCDAVRVGGGMGNIARKPATKEQVNAADKDVRKHYQGSHETTISSVSGHARFWEGASYFLQWAGAPYSVYSYTNSLNDYVDDYASRALWVNWLNGGSANNPDETGEKIPLDMALAFHTDAGVNQDSIIGTLTIHTLNGNAPFKTTYPSGESRAVGRDLADIVGAQIVSDLRATIAPDWNDRGIRNKSYFESRVSQVPTALLELLSHQNYNDMRYGLNPEFKFIVSRAVYKAILRFIADRNNFDYVVQPLPVTKLAAEIKGDSVRLTWEPRVDILEPTAQPTAYIVYQGRDGACWDNGTLVNQSFISLPIKEGVHTSFKITAVNDGGESMDSEVATVYKAYNSRGNIMIINGFDRVAAPEGFSAGNFVGFAPFIDRGVADGFDPSFAGDQQEYDITKPWLSDDSAGWGDSKSNHDFDVMAGNMRSYAYLHGLSIAACGFSYSYINASVLDSISSSYAAVDLILGEQKKTYLPAIDLARYAVFTPAICSALSDYAADGGAIFASGAYVVSDSKNDSTSQVRDFIKSVFGAKWRADKATSCGKVQCVNAPKCSFTGRYSFVQEPNGVIYAAEQPDALVPSVKGAYSVMRYFDNGSSAAVAYKSTHSALLCGFPFETILTQQERDSFMLQVLRFLIPQ